MDINGTHCHLLYGARDWQPTLSGQSPSGLWWDDDNACVTLTPTVPVQAEAAVADTLTWQDRRGAACDRYGNIFWLGDAKDSNGVGQPGQYIKMLPAGDDRAGDYWSIGTRASASEDIEGEFHSASTVSSPQYARLQGLTVTREHYLVVGTINPAGLLVFDLHGGGPPRHLRWPDATRFRPFDLAPAADGGLWILDWDGGVAKGRYWRLDRHFRVMAERFVAERSPAFRPADDTARDPLCAPVRDMGPGSAVPIADDHPIAILGLEDDSVLLLSNPASLAHPVVGRYRDGVRIDRVELDSDGTPGLSAGAVIQAHDFAFLAREPSLTQSLRGELTVVLTSGDRALSFDLHVDDLGLAVTLQPRLIPLRRFSGRALIAGADQAIYYDMGERWYPLVSQPRRRYAGEGTFHCRFDGKQPGCVWHRIVLEGCIPEGTAVDVNARAADAVEQLDHAPWHGQPSPCRRPRAHQPAFASVPGEQTWEWLFQRAQGRHLELAVTLRGNTRASPRVSALWVYYPRFSYVDNFLPALYREHDHQRFLERYLANVEGLFSGMETLIAGAQRLFDTRTAPAEFLDWLAGWLGGIIDPDWEASRKRLFIDYALVLYRWRGTRVGLRAALRLATEDCPDERVFDDLQTDTDREQPSVSARSLRVVERFTQRRLPGVASDQPVNAGRGSARRSSDTLKTRQVSVNLSELGDLQIVNQRYRAFLRRRYGEGEPAIDQLNLSWQANPPYKTYSEIHFSLHRPERGQEQADWSEFLRRELALRGHWHPDQGAFALHVRFQEWLRSRYSREVGLDEALARLNDTWGTQFERFEDIAFSPVTPADRGKAADWHAFLERGLGFTYSPVALADQTLYQDFLARRYRSIKQLNRAHDLNPDRQWSAFSSVELPAEHAMPEHGRALQDWITFVSLTLPIRRDAHRFSVLLPTVPGELPEQRERRLIQAERVVRAEKPAHTDYDIGFFWALFQVGSARIGSDTVLGEGARYVSVILGGSYLGQGMVGRAHPWDISDRTVLGRAPLQHIQHGDSLS